MTEKQEIIIDGVNITGCTWCDFEPDVEPYCHINDGEDLGCEDNPNCYYKQLARKTQECEQKEKELLSNEKIINKLMKEVDELKQECEKLKNQVDEDYNYYITELKTLRDIISNKEKRNAALFLMSNRYRKAFEEIEEIVKDWYKNEWSCYMCRKNMDKKLEDILDIINKAKRQ